MLRTCWSHTPTKRPTAGEIVELFYNNPRLVSPSIDVPLASIQVERSDSLELLPRIKHQQTGMKLNLKNSEESLIEERSELPLQGVEEEELSTFLGPCRGRPSVPGYVVLDHTAASLWSRISTALLLLTLGLTARIYKSFIVNIQSDKLVADNCDKWFERVYYCEIWSKWMHYSSDSCISYTDTDSLEHQCWSNKELCKYCQYSAVQIQISMCYCIPPYKCIAINSG